MLQRLKLKPDEQNMIRVNAAAEIKALFARVAAERKAAEEENTIPGVQPMAKVKATPTVVRSIGSIAAAHKTSAVAVLNCAARLSLRPAFLIDQVAHYSADAADRIGVELSKPALKGLAKFTANNPLPGDKKGSK